MCQLQGAGTKQLMVLPGDLTPAILSCLEHPPGQGFILLPVHVYPMPWKARAPQYAFMQCDCNSY